MKKWEELSVKFSLIFYPLYVTCRLTAACSLSAISATNIKKHNDILEFIIFRFWIS